MSHMPPCPSNLPQHVFAEPVQVFEDFFHPQVVQVIHPIEIVKRHHFVPVPQHVASYSVKDVCCISSRRSKRRR